VTPGVRPWSPSDYRGQVLVTRIADEADTAAIARLWTAANAARRTETGLPLGPVAGSDLDGADALVRRRLSGPAAFAVLAEDRGEVVAMALVLQALAEDGASSEPVPGLAHVSMVAVRPDRWGQRLGALVLDAALAEGRERGFRRAQLWTHESNGRGRRLYERLGWVASGRTKTDDFGERIRHYVRDL
jgi:GNAT superfamily N-acetyltransferase